MRLGYWLPRNHIGFLGVRDEQIKRYLVREDALFLVRNEKVGVERVELGG